MPIRWDKFTVKCEHGNPELRPLHLLAALLEDKEGIVPPVLEKIGIGRKLSYPRCTKRSRKLPRPPEKPPQATLSKRSHKQQAFKEASDFKDEYVSTEHLLLAITARATGTADPCCPWRYQRRNLESARSRPRLAKSY